MLVTLTPGVDRDRVLELLRSASIMIGNNTTQDGYVRWVLDTGRMLRGQVAWSDLDQLLFTPAFYRLADPVLMGTPQGGLMLEAEMTERQTLLAAAFDTLRRHIEMWSATAAGDALAVVDTSVFLSHPAWTRDDDPTVVIASIPWAEELHLGFEDVLLVLPEVVIRELDRLKESSNKTTRYRASVTLAVVDQLLTDPHSTVRIRTKDSDWTAIAERGEMPRGEVQLRMFYDDPAHRPLSDPDAEIIDRALAVQTLAAKQVQLVTMDTGMGLNARRAGLHVMKPARAIEAPPAEGQPTRPRRRAEAAEQATP